MLQIGDIVKLRANQNLCGFIEYIEDDRFCYVAWFNHDILSHSFPYVYTSLIKVS